MIKKGKSCLFKISLDTLAMHLSNTPMYIMVIDEYPEVPKLLGNSSLAFNEVMDAIKVDINKNGHTVPSVHGDKGLFKVYSLMGKEIGYMILGFRLLSLGPGLIAHLPATAMVKRASESNRHNEQKSVIDEIIEVKQQTTLHGASHSVMPKKKAKTPRHEDKMNNSREMGSMTDVEKCDALMQTVDMNGEKFHVAVSAKEKGAKQGRTIETQTERILKKQREVQKKVDDFKLNTEDSEESDDGLFFNPNVICPPPLFYNSKAEPDVRIEKDTIGYRDYESSFGDATLEDLSGDEHTEAEKEIPKVPKKIHETNALPTRMIQEVPQIHDAKTVKLTNIKKGETTPATHDLNLAALNPNEPVFPLLTALLTELSKIQNPQFVNQAIGQVQQAALNSKAEPTKKQETVKRTNSDQNLSDIKEEAEKESNVSSKRKGRKSHKSCAHASDGVPKQKGWIRKAPEVEVKKTKLVFGMTNTQRLRLAKQNPTWLKTAEQEEKLAKSQKQKPSKTTDFDQEMDTGNLSDTYTEVRRLAAVELAKTTMGQTNIMDSLSKTPKSNKKWSKSRDNSPAKNTSKQNRSRSKSPKSTKGLKAAKKLPVKQRNLSNRDNEEVVDLDPDAHYIESPDLTKGDKLDSVADSIPSSRIEVHIPSAKAYESDGDDDTFTEDFETETPSDQNKGRNSKFPGFSTGDTSLPDPIAHDGTTSMNTTQEFDDDSPLESTRVSKQFRSMPPAGESLFKSTEDYDTKQFQSTDEPELLDLMSEDEKTETLITPATDRSIQSVSPLPTGASKSTRLSMNFEVLNPKASQQSPLPAVRRSQQLKIDSINARPTPTDTGTPRSRSSRGTPSPRQRKPIRERKMDFKKDSIHTESVSSYQPSESENILSLISDGSYSDDFNASSGRDISSKMSTPDLFPKLIPSTKLGFTIG